jgi:beta-N-acetylhexosaminidase
MKPIILAPASTRLTDDERRLFRDMNPAGFILFTRNIETREQVRCLTNELRSVTGRDDLPILIDQEGGRVQRMRPPEWPVFPSGAAFAALYEQAPMTAIAAMRSNAEMLGLTLAEVGITANCAPVLDLSHPQTHAAIGDRALGTVPMQVAALGRAMLDGMAAGGVAGVIKHIPGQGRACVDTHHDLAHVTAALEELDQDFMPFKALNIAPMAMAAHVVYDAVDPDHPATQSAKCVALIRSVVGFDGLLMTDDIEMNALSGPVEDRCLTALAAGYDVVLHCSADFKAMAALNDTLPPITDAAKARIKIPQQVFSNDRLAAVRAHRDALMTAVL